MQDITWSTKEKLLARTVFERAAVAEEQALMERFKREAAALKSMDDLGAFQLAIRDAQREYQQKYDYRYSQLLWVFGRLVREGRISMDALHGLDEQKLAFIERIAAL